MSQVNKRLLVIGLILVVIMMGSGVYALAAGGGDSSSLSVANVDIKINEYTLNSENQEVIYNEQNKIVEPGQIISLIEKVKNLGAECYVRAKITMEGANAEECVQGISDSWQKIGEYYYYKYIVGVNDEIKIFDIVKIPLDVSNDLESQIKLIVVVDAVQSRNFEPNFNSENPWNGIEIEKSIYNNYSIDEDTSKLTIEYDNNTNKYIEVPDDFMRDLNNMLPGDTVQKQITIKKTDKEQAEFFISIDTDDLKEEQKALLKNIPVKITDKNGKLIYDGALDGLQTAVSLGIYKLNEDDLLTIEIKLPEEAQNNYEGIFRNIRWKFSAKYSGQEQESKSKSIRTGDFGLDLSLLLFFTSAISLIIVLALMNAERKKNTQNI